MPSKKATKPSGQKRAKRAAKPAGKAAAPRVERPAISDEESLENLKAIVGKTMLDEKFRKRLLSNPDKVLAKYPLNEAHRGSLIRAIEDPSAVEALIVLFLRELGVKYKAL